MYHVVGQNGPKSDVAERLEAPSITVDGQTLTIRGKLLGLDVEHRFTAAKERPILEERVVVHNSSNQLVALTDFEVGMQRRVADKDGNVLPEFAADRLVAVPFRHRAVDPKGKMQDYSLQEVVGQPGVELQMDGIQCPCERPSRHRVSEGWAWTHGGRVLCMFKFCQEHMQFSVVSKHQNAKGAYLRFGGATMLFGEPAGLCRMAPGATVDLGVVRYETLEGGYQEAMYAFRAMLDEKGCRFPKDFNPPVHWEQLYDMDGAWNDRLHRFTKAIVEKEAEKGAAYRCEALYLDPGWDTAFGSFIWGESWLGPRRQFIDAVQSKYGLKVSLHCPLATWMSRGGPWRGFGPDADHTFPPESRRITPNRAEDPVFAVPAATGQRRNLALLPNAKPGASSAVSIIGHAFYQAAHLNDGWYGNMSAWIPEQMPARAELDLGDVYSIDEVCLSNDSTGVYGDRAPTELRILTATDYAADSSAKSWRETTRYTGLGLQKKQRFTFPAAKTRWVRVEITKCASDLPRLDEIEVYESAPSSQADVDAFAKQAKRGMKPVDLRNGPTICLGSKQYLDAAAKRLLDCCDDGVVFLMFDGNFWNGGCLNPDHGHPVPYRMEDHIRANLELAKRIHAKHPEVFIEMHDMITGGAQFRYTPIYYKYGLPGSYDMNWGFELMWNPMQDIVEGRTTALYYANLASNVPFYTHVNLARDNSHCIVLWWYASTCRHLGIGGTNTNPDIVKAQQEAMRWYRQRDRFYKRGEFYGISEEIHLHVLPEENAFTVNVFNLSGEKKRVGGSIDLKRLGLNPSLKYVSAEELGAVENGRYRVDVELPPWGAKVGSFGQRQKVAGP
jgi:hypothetical protein